MKLRSKLILALLPSIAAPLVALGSIAYVQQSASVKEASLRELDSLVDQIGRYVDARVEAARSDVVLFSNSKILTGYLLVEDEAQRYRLFQPGVLKLFASYQRANPECCEIRILLPDGYEDTRATLADVPNRTEEEGGTEYFRSLAEAEGDLVMQVVHSRDTGEPALLVSRRISLLDDSADPILSKPKLRGYLLVSMSLDFLADRMREVHIGHGGRIHIVRGDGRVLFSSDGEHRHGPKPVPFLDELYELARSGAIGRTRHHGEIDLARGQELYENLYLYAAIPEYELLASTRRLALVTLILVVGSVVLTSAVLDGVLNSLLLGPLAKLGQATREIGRGNLVTDVGIRRGDEIGKLATSFEDMSRNLRQSHEQISYLAYHDSLTGLPNRLVFSEALERVTHTRRYRQVLALLFVDVDDFKRINDLLGHQAGDELLREIADRLASVVRPYDTVSRREAVQPRNAVARVGGDEFLILLANLDDPLQAAGVAQRILDKLAIPMRAGERNVQVNASIGITTHPQDGDTAEALIRNADIAMYEAKQQGKNQYRFCTAEMNDALIERVEMEHALRKAIERNELRLHYQPQVDAETGEIVATEALVRWHSPERGVIMPGAFIPLAEDTGPIVSLGYWVLQEACRQNRAWQDAGLPPIPVAVNISNRQFADDALKTKVERVLARTALDPRYLDLELTETSIMESPERAARTLAALKKLGVQISMDDFGTGYSSLSALKHLPIDCLKIDQSFVRDIAPDAEDAAIVTTVIVMGKSLSLTVLAEGVEEEAELSFLREPGCDRIQGYLVSRPAPPAEMEAPLRARPRPPMAEEKPNLESTRGRG
jgi:diguanylate cyclase (GGDEF)-like protein